MLSTNDRREFGAQLWALADLVQADEKRRSFRAKAYRAALWSLDDLPVDLEATRDEILKVPGLGAGLANLIEEFRVTGTLRQLARLQGRYPRDVARLRRLPRMGQGLLRSLKSDLGLETVADLRQALDAGEAAQLKGVGPATVRLWEAILDDDLSEGLPAHRAFVLAEMIRRHLIRHLDDAVEASGGVRRLEETVESVDLVVGTTDRRQLEGLLRSTAVAADSEVRFDYVKIETHSGETVFVYPAEPESFGTDLATTTGPPDHLAEVLAPLPVAREESDVYARKGLPWIPAPARGRPIEEAVKSVRIENVKGDFHLHTNASPDGRLGLEDLVAAVRHRGYQYILVTDHTHGLRFGGLSDEGIAAQAAEIDHISRVVPDIEIFHGAELNIDVDSSLDLGAEALGLLDFAVASVHSRFDLDEEAQTRRVIEAVRHPVVKILGHPTGRRIGIRPSLNLDLDAIFEAAAGEGVALESNGHRDRLDLPAAHIETARSYGCVFAANSDAHRLSELRNIENGVGTLQRAGVTADEVINTWDVARLRDWIG